MIKRSNVKKAKVKRHKRLRSKVKVNINVKEKAGGLTPTSTCIFIFQPDLERHMFAQHKINISRLKIVKCKKCNHWTHEGSSMNRHVLNHTTGEYTCQHCSKVFATKRKFFASVLAGT